MKALEIPVWKIKLQVSVHEKFHRQEHSKNTVIETRVIDNFSPVSPYGLIMSTSWPLLVFFFSPNDPGDNARQIFEGVLGFS